MDIWNLNIDIQVQDHQMAKYVIFFYIKNGQTDEDRSVFFIWPAIGCFWEMKKDFIYLQKRNIVYKEAIKTNPVKAVFGVYLKSCSYFCIHSILLKYIQIISKCLIFHWAMPSIPTSV